jgi:hypothetical protein
VKTSQWIVGTLIAVGFTSTLLHYYYDGFIWKVRNKENQRHLAMQQSPDAADHHTASWWDTHNQSSVLATILRQGLYFGLPILVVTVSYWMVTQNPLGDPYHQVQRARKLADDGFIDQSVQEAKLAIVGINKQLEIERRMIEIRPRALHFTFLADLVYLKSLTMNRLIYLADPATDAEARSRHRRALETAIDSLEKALAISGPFGHRKNTELEREDVESLLASRRQEIDELDK